MITRRPSPSLLAIVLLIACQPSAPPRPQALVHIDTDAPVPRMVNRLSLALLDADLNPVCDSCTRVFGLDETTVWPVSFGVASAADGSPRYLRATLFPAGRTVAGAPQPHTALDRIVRVHPPLGQVVENQQVFLPADCAGIPPDAAARTSCPSTGGAPVPIEDAGPGDGAPTRAGSWHADHARPCAGEPRPDSDLHDGEVCIAGGVFWMGDFRARGMGLLDGVPEHAVAVSPFFIDRYEYTMGRYRAALAAGFRSGLPPPRTGAQGKWCSWTGDPADGSADRLPLNCVVRELAEDLCAWDGDRRLPTEAEWEWAAGGRERERMFPWGDAPQWPGDPKEKQAVPVGTHPLDVTADGVHDMSINVSEVVRDTWDTYAGPCWKPGTYGPDPWCEPAIAADPDIHVNRGGYYGAGSPGLATTVGRLVSFGQAPQMGFRCARSAR